MEMIKPKPLKPKAFYCQVATNIDLAQAADLVIATKSLLEEYRDDTICQYAVSIAKLHIEPSL